MSAFPPPVQPWTYNEYRRILFDGPANLQELMWLWLHQELIVFVPFHWWLMAQGEAVYWHFSDMADWIAGRARPTPPALPESEDSDG